MIRFKQLFYESDRSELKQKILNAQTLEEAEDLISSDVEVSFEYAKNVI